MIRAIQEYFSRSLQFTPAESQDDTRLHLAAAALMIELIYIDENIAKAEKARMTHLLQHTWGISRDDIDNLVNLAEKEVDNAHDLYQFTRLINDNYSYEMKCNLVQSLWEIAYADNELNKYEEAMIRKLSDLLYVQHADFIRGKQNAQANG